MKIKIAVAFATAIFYLLIFTSVEIPIASASVSASISSFVLYSERLIRKEESARRASRPKAMSAELGVAECEEQADPLDTNIPFEESICSIVSLLMLGRVIFIT